MKAIVKVKLKEGILDPQGRAVKTALHHLGYQKIKDVRIGKYIELDIDENDFIAIKGLVTEASHKLLANPVIEDYFIDIEEGKR